jgi:hypothetical protein
MELPQHTQTIVVPGLSQLVIARRFPYYRQTALRGLWAQDPYQMTTEERERFERECRAGLYDYSGPPSLGRA